MYNGDMVENPRQMTFANWIATRKCKRCGNKLSRRQSKFCSHYCASFKGGYINVDGYRVITVNKKCVFEHRHVMQKEVGRELTANETVHHLNGDRRDNRIANLQLYAGRHQKGVATCDRIPGEKIHFQVNGHILICENMYTLQWARRRILGRVLQGGKFVKAIRYVHWIQWFATSGFSGVLTSPNAIGNPPAEHDLHWNLPGRETTVMATYTVDDRELPLLGRRHL